jgi:Ras and EF-hand domain-containing protein
MFKVVFCGDAAVGKSTLIMRLCKDKFMPNATATLGVDFHNKQIEIDDKRIALQLWDTAGQERLDTFISTSFY